MGQYITGTSRNQITLFPDIIDEYINDDNAVRVIDAYVDRLDMASLDFSKSIPNDTGRPPYSPQDLLKLYIYGYLNRIRSSRRLETESKRNLEVIWLLKKLSPDHKTIARFRSDNPVALKNVFRDFVKLCLNLGLYGRELAAIDGSKFKAVNSTDRNFSMKELNERIKRLSIRIDEYIRQLNESDLADDNGQGSTSDDAGQSHAATDDIKRIIERLSTRKDTYEAYLEELATSGETQKSLTDPEARLMRGAKGFDVSYNVQASVDSKHKLIAEFNVSNDGNDMRQLATMAISTSEILETPHITATADTGYNNPSEIAKCIEAGIIPQIAGSEGNICIPCDAHETHEIKSYKNGKCVYLKDRNVVICPMGNVLFPRHYKNVDRTARYYNYSACNKCTQKCMKSKCMAFGVRMKKSEFSKEYNIDGLLVKQIYLSPDPETINHRKELAEHPFGTIKRSMDTGYLLTKGI